MGGSSLLYFSASCSPAAPLRTAKQGLAASRSQSISDGYALTCYPNPVTNIAQFTYQIPEDAHVTLVVYDILGNRVATLQNGYETRGTHTAVFDSNGLPNGLYIYRLAAGSQVQTGKLNLQRK